MTYTNRLIHEKSPYLLQHAHNPVDWYPWGQEAFQKAKGENKPIFLSIGYSTCHWCHVMEEESFENPKIAQILNEYFVPIKVDREERGDIDNIYMSVVMAITGSGGWPLSVFLTPDKKPFYGGTYFPPEAKWGSVGFADLLLSIQEAWAHRQDQILHSSQSITEALKSRYTSAEKVSPHLNQQTLENAYLQLMKNFDSVYGGFGQAPKFPMGHNLSFLLRYWKRTANANALEMVEKTLTEMAHGGMYDHLGGGFHRYSTDPEWQVSHFEKMLYDQAILAKAYLEAYQATGKDQYAEVVRGIFEYVLRDMQAPEGGFFSAEDADSLDPKAKQSDSNASKKEGAYYLWEETEIIDVLGQEEAKIFNYYFRVGPSGNVHYDPHGEFVGKNILYSKDSLGEVASHFGKHEEEIKGIIEAVQKKLLLARSKRPRPHLDDKILVDWNGLLISSLAFGSRVLNEPRYREAAQKAADFILNHCRNEQGRLFHRYRDGQSAILGMIDDYAFFIHGLLDLYEATFEIFYLKEAHRLTEEMIRLFWDEERGGFFFTAHDGEQLILRQKEIYDGAVPSGNSIAALDFLRIYHFTFSQLLEQRFERLCDAFTTEIARLPSAYVQLLIAFDFFVGPSLEIIVAAHNHDAQVDTIVAEIYRGFIPNKIVALNLLSDRRTKEVIELIPFIKEKTPLQGKPTVYICEHHACQPPITDFDQLKGKLAKNSTTIS